jgi:hypothetical protein
MPPEIALRAGMQGPQFPEGSAPGSLAVIAVSMSKTLQQADATKLGKRLHDRTE